MARGVQGVARDRLLVVAFRLRGPSPRFVDLSQPVVRRRIARVEAQGGAEGAVGGGQPPRIEVHAPQLVGDRRGGWIQLLGVAVRRHRPRPVTVLAPQEAERAPGEGIRVPHGRRALDHGEGRGVPLQVIEREAQADVRVELRGIEPDGALEDVHGLQVPLPVEQQGAEIGVARGVGRVGGHGAAQHALGILRARGRHVQGGELAARLHVARILRDGLLEVHLRLALPALLGVNEAETVHRIRPARGPRVGVVERPARLRQPAEPEIRQAERVVGGGALGFDADGLFEERQSGRIAPLSDRRVAFEKQLAGAQRARRDIVRPEQLEYPLQLLRRPAEARGRRLLGADAQMIGHHFLRVVLERCGQRALDVEQHRGGGPHRKEASIHRPRARAGRLEQRARADRRRKGFEGARQRRVDRRGVRDHGGPRRRIPASAPGGRPRSGDLHGDAGGASGGGVNQSQGPFRVADALRHLVTAGFLPDETPDKGLQLPQRHDPILGVRVGHSLEAFHQEVREDPVPSTPLRAFPGGLRRLAGDQLGDIPPGMRQGINRAPSAVGVADDNPLGFRSPDQLARPAGVSDQQHADAIRSHRRGGVLQLAHPHDPAVRVAAGIGVGRQEIATLSAGPHFGSAVAGEVNDGLVPRLRVLAQPPQRFGHMPRSRTGVHEQADVLRIDGATGPGTEELVHHLGVRGRVVQLFFPLEVEVAGDADDHHTPGAGETRLGGLLAQAALPRFLRSGGGAGAQPQYEEKDEAARAHAGQVLSESAPAPGHKVSGLTPPPRSRSIRSDYRRAAPRCTNPRGRNRASPPPSSR